MFATLDPTTRRVVLPGGNVGLFTDTVGFIQKLPTTLVEAFHATLEEITEAELLLHVVDISHPNAIEQYQSVMQTLDQIGAAGIPLITVLNKVDKLKGPGQFGFVPFTKGLRVSAKTGEGLPDIINRVKSELYENYKSIKVFLPYQEGNLISMFHESGQIEQITHVQGGVEIVGKIPGRLFTRFSGFVWKPKPEPEKIAND